MRKKVLLGLILVVLAGIQFIRPARNLSPAPAGKDDLVVGHAAPPEVRRLLEIGCYDCHSNHTRYPWYASIQPVGWWLAKHIDDGKGELNLSEFGAYSEKRQGRKLDAMMDELSEHTMPLKSYTLIHRDAKFTDAQVKLLCDWLQAERDKLPD